MNNLKTLREASGLRREELAAATETSFEYIRKLETGDADNPSLRRARRIAEVLGITVDEVFPPAGAEGADHQTSVEGGVRQPTADRVEPASVRAGAGPEAAVGGTASGPLCGNGEAA